MPVTITPQYGTRELYIRTGREKPLWKFTTRVDTSLGDISRRTLTFLNSEEPEEAAVFPTRGKIWQPEHRLPPKTVNYCLLDEVFTDEARDPDDFEDINTIRMIRSSYAKVQQIIDARIEEMPMSVLIDWREVNKTWSKASIAIAKDLQKSHQSVPKKFRIHLTTHPANKTIAEKMSGPEISRESTVSTKEALNSVLTTAGLKDITDYELLRFELEEHKNDATFLNGSEPRWAHLLPNPSKRGASTASSATLR